VALAAAGVVHRPWDTWLATLRARDAAREDDIRRRAAVTGAAVNPLALCQAIEAAADDDSVFVLDGGDFAATASYVLTPRGPLRHLDPGVFGTLGVGAGFALGAKLHRPEAEVWIVYGDGAAAYSLAEFDSFVRHGLPVIAVVGNDAGWTQIAREQRALLGDDVGTVLRHTDYDVVARGYGGVGFRVARLEELGPALAQAKAAARAGTPALVNVLIDPTDFRSGSISM
jgi:acetolactate synthase-1/2/3 large subunit